MLSSSQNRAVPHSEMESDTASKFMEGWDMSSIRSMKGSDGIERFSVYDFINEACSKSAGDCYGRITFCRLADSTSEFKEKLNVLTTKIQFPGVSSVLFVFSTF